MAEKYRFDKERMEFRRITHSLWGVLGTVLKYFLVTASLAFVYYLLFSAIISTDSDRKLKRENKLYKQMYAEMVGRGQLVGDVVEGLKAKDNTIYTQLFKSDAPDQGVLSGDALISVEDSVRDEDIVKYAGRKLDALAQAGARVEENLRRVESAYSKASSAQAALPPLTSPLKGFVHARTGASVGERINPFYKVPVFHGGLDLIAQQGDSVCSAGAGVVDKVVHSRKGLGNVVEVRHEGGWLTRYAQLENIRVHQGQKVDRGSLLGQVGMSGNSFAPHLHYEVLKDSLRFDPVNFFFASVAPEDYVGMMFLSVNTGQSLD